MGEGGGGKIQKVWTIEKRFDPPLFAENYLWANTTLSIDEICFFVVIIHIFCDKNERNIDLDEKKLGKMWIPQWKKLKREKGIIKGKKGMFKKRSVKISIKGF